MSRAKASSMAGAGLFQFVRHGQGQRERVQGCGQRHAGRRPPAGNRPPQDLYGQIPIAGDVFQHRPTVEAHGLAMGFDAARDVDRPCDVDPAFGDLVHVHGGEGEIAVELDPRLLEIAAADQFGRLGEDRLGARVLKLAAVEKAERGQGDAQVRPVAELAIENCGPLDMRQHQGLGNVIPEIDRVAQHARRDRRRRVLVDEKDELLEIAPSFAHQRQHMEEERPDPPSASAIDLRSGSASAQSSAARRLSSSGR